MFRSYTGMLCFLIKYLRILINFSLLKTILAIYYILYTILNEEIELLKQFSLKHFDQNYLMLNSVSTYFWLKAMHTKINPIRFNLGISRFCCTCSVGLYNLV